MNKPFVLNASKFLSVSLKLGLEACQIIKDSYMNKNVKQFMKGKNDPVTEADYKIQSMYSKGYKLHFPGLKLVGEQQTEYEGLIQTDFEKLSLPELPNKIQFPKEYELQRCCLWIDPLDNTRGFIEGEIEAVTTLIGMSYDSKAEFGIVGIPFKKHEGKVSYNPSLLLGSVSGGFAYQYFPNQQKWVHLQNDSPLSEKVRIAMSPTRSNIIETKIMEQLKGEKILAGGSGYKMALVATKQVELMAYNLSFTHKWDTCAGEAVIRGMRGLCTTQWGDEIEYNSEKPKQSNKQGVICSLNKQLHEKVIKLSKLFSKNANF